MGNGAASCYGVNWRPKCEESVTERVIGAGPIFFVMKILGKNKEEGVSSLLNILSMNEIKNVHHVQYISCTIFLKQEASIINIETA